MYCAFYTRLLFLLASLSLATANAEETAKRLFEQNNKSVYQVRVIDTRSGDKYSIGSGFLVNESGLIATNFHVIAAHVHEPEKYKLEIISSNKSVEAVKLKAVDVVHDLALLQIAPEIVAGIKVFQLDTAKLTKGAKLYSMGNPHDLGMTIIEGNYNGLVQYVRHDNILFSGSLNPGMSGGPAFDSRGNVIGINVAKGQEQISFLVPAKHLLPLLEQTALTTPAEQTELTALNSSEDFRAIIAAQLFADQDVFYGKILAKEFSLQQLGEVSLPEQMSERLNCWGHSQEDEDDQYASVHRHCKTDDRIFVQDDIYLGHFSYDYEWNSSERFSGFKFYEATRSRFTHGWFSRVSDEDDVTSPRCSTRRIKLAGIEWKASTCLRLYKKLASLYDMSFLLNSLTYSDKSILLKLQASGISLENATAIQKKLMESIQWNK